MKEIAPKNALSGVRSFAFLLPVSSWLYSTAVLYHTYMVHAGGNLCTMSLCAMQADVRAVCRSGYEEQDRAENFKTKPAGTYR